MQLGTSSLQNIRSFTSLKETDSELFKIIEKEKKRQSESIELIASENFTSKSVMEANSSVLTNKYSEGYPGARYYGGTQFIDENERLCIKRAINAFRLNPDEWGVNVQPLSGSPANFAVYNALLEPHDRLMGLDLASGGHLTHGFISPAGKRISATSKFWESLPYFVNSDSGLIDYNELQKLASIYKPKLIIAGASAYPRHYEYKRMREICNSVGALMMADMAHISGLVAANLAPSPFKHADVVTTTTHKTLRGPRSGIIFFRRGMCKTKRGDQWDLENRINNSVFPALQGGPHQHTIAAVSTALHQASQPMFIEYQKNVLENAQGLADALLGFGFSLVTGGTSNHLLLVDCKSKGIDGARVEKVLEKCLVSVNKNTIPGDLKPFVPSGIRIGTPAMTTRGLKKNDFIYVAYILNEGVDIACRINLEEGASRGLKSFQKILEEGHWPEIIKLREEVRKFMSNFKMP